MDKKIELSGIFKEGYGMVPKLLMKAQDISSNTKLVLCYLLSYTGSGVSAFPNIEDMANNLCISKRTIIRCIQDAQSNGYLYKNQIQLGRGKGKSNNYTLLFMEHSPVLRDENASAKIAHAKNARANDDNASVRIDIKTALQVTGMHPIINNIIIINIINKGYVFPNNLKNEEFLLSLHEWIEYKKEIKSKYTETGLKKLINKLSKFDNDACIKAIENSISNNWKGLFPESIKNNVSKQDAFFNQANKLYEKYGADNEQNT